MTKRPVNILNHEGLTQCGYEHISNVKEKGKVVSVYQHKTIPGRIVVHASGRTRVDR